MRLIDDSEVSGIFQSMSEWRKYNMPSPQTDDGISNVTPATFQKHLRLITQAKDKVDEATGSYRAARKAAEAVGIDLKTLAMFEKLRKMDGEDAALRLKTLARYARFMAMPWGSQIDMFGDTEEEMSEEDTEAALNVQAGQDGYNRGAAGDDVDNNPHPAGTSRHVAWHAGWKRGQALYAKNNPEGQAPKRRGRPSKAAVENVTGSPLN